AVALNAADVPVIAGKPALLGAGSVRGGAPQAGGMAPLALVDGQGVAGVFHQGAELGVVESRQVAALRVAGQGYSRRAQGIPDPQELDADPVAEGGAEGHPVAGIGAPAGAVDAPGVGDPVQVGL